jgi:hypothetical protein
VTVVGAGDRLYDRKPETNAPAWPRGVGAGEALKRGGKELGRETVTFVCDVELELTVGKSRVDVDRSFAVAEGIFDQV